MKIKWLGTACLLLQSDGHKILFDPYLRKLNKSLSAFPLEEIRDVEAIFITHPHMDHFADIPVIIKHTDCPVYTNERGMDIAKKLRFDLSHIRRISLGDVFVFGSLTLKVCRGRHVEFDKAVVRGAIKRTLKGQLVNGLKLSNLNNKMNIDLKNDVFSFYLCEGGKTALILGSANYDGHAERPEADLLVYPYQGRNDMLEYSLKLVKSLSPKTVICDHFDDAFPPLSTRMNVEEFQKRLESESSIKVIIPAENENICI